MSKNKFRLRQLITLRSMLELSELGKDLNC